MPIILDNYGDEIYAVYLLLTQISTNFITIMFVFNYRINYYSGMVHQNHRKSNIGLNKLFTLSIVCSIITIPLIGFLTINLEEICGYYGGDIHDFRVYFFIVSISFLISSLFSVYNSLYLSRNEISIFNFTQLLSGVFRFILILLFCVYLNASFYYIGYSTLLSTILIVIISYLVFKLRYQIYDIKLCKVDLFFIINEYRLGFLSYINKGFDLLVINIELLIFAKFNQSILSYYTLSLPFISSVKLVFSFLAGACEGRLFLLASGSEYNIRKYIFKINNFFFFMFFLPSLFFSYNIVYIYDIWLGKDYIEITNSLIYFIPILVISLCNTIYSILFYVKSEQIVLNVINILYVLLLLAIAPWLNYFYQFLIIVAILYIFKNIIILPFIFWRGRNFKMSILPQVKFIFVYVVYACLPQEQFSVTMMLFAVMIFSFCYIYFHRRNYFELFK
ncbi:TPA: hypothetical protein ACX6NP_003644 [Photobacterium damselae]